MQNKAIRLSWVVLCAVALQTSNAAAPSENWAAAESEQWKVVDASRSAIEPGSALDMSRFVEAPAGKYGRAILDAQGHMVFEKRPEQRVIFFGCSIEPFRLLGRSYTTKEEIRRWAEMVRRQGYNLVRPHFLDHYLTEASKTDLEFDPEALDRFDYLVFCLKENGIYLYLDAMTSWRGYMAGPGYAPKAHAQAFKSRIFGEPEVRRHWETGVKKLLQHVNPYTKTRLADDPLVTCVLFFNEQNLNFYRTLPEAFLVPWRAWLTKKYGTTETFRKAWVDERGKSLLKGGVTLENVPIFEPRDVWAASARGRDIGLFVYDIHAELYDWYVRSVREAGYGGLVSQYDWLPNLGHQALRNRVPVISMHGYHAHPSDFVTKGSTVSQESALATANRWFNSMLTTRYGGRPLLITEYGQVFWNRYRYEEGLSVGGYAALQDIDCLMAHCNPVWDQMRSPMHPFWVAHDPVARASQVVSGFAFLRRDVTPSPHYVDIALQKAHVFDAVKHASSLSPDQSKLALLTGVGLSYADEAPPAGLSARKGDLRLPVFGTAETIAKEFFSDVREAVGGDQPLAGVVATLKGKKILPPDNRTDVAAGIYESDTGQLLLDGRRHQLRVITPRMEGACIDPAVAKDPIALKQLTIDSSSVPASVTAIAADDRPLPDSRRILLVYATDALNSGMTFTGDKRETLVALGKPPILLRTGRVKATLTTRNAAGMKLWALGLDGRRIEAIAPAAQGELLVLDIDTARLKSATPFFELAKE